MLLTYDASSAKGAPPRNAATPKSIIEYLNRRLGRLRHAYEDGEWRAHHCELSDYILPRRGRFLSRNPKRGRKVNRNVLSPTPIRAAETFANGFNNGMTSQARNWFDLTLEDEGLLDISAVRDWLSRCQRLISQWMDTSNLYTMLPEIYVELAVFGTTCSVVMEDYKTLFRIETFTAGEYYVARNSRGMIDTMMREYECTVENAVDEFGLEACSAHVQQKYRDKHYDDCIKVGHAIEPNRDALPNMPGQQNMPFRSVYWEISNPDKDRFLSYKGFEESALLAPRWSVSGDDAYGRGPGMDALPECKALKQAIIRKEQAKERVTIGHFTAPSALKNSGAFLLPGGVTYVDASDAALLRNVYEKYNPYLEVQILDIEKYVQKIEKIFYNDILYAISNMPGAQPRNIVEITERKQEKLQQLGSGSARFGTEFLQPLIDRIWSIADRAGMIPTPPSQVAGKKVKVVFVGPLALAQKAESILGLERSMSFVGSLAASFPGASDKVNPDRAIDKYWDLTNSPSDVLATDDEVNQIRNARQAAQRQAQAAQMPQALAQVAKGAQLLSQTRTASGRTALDDVEAATPT